MRTVGHGLTRRTILAGAASLLAVGAVDGNERYRSHFCRFSVDSDSPPHLGQTVATAATNGRDYEHYDG